MTYDEPDEDFLDLVGGAWVACPYCGEDVEILVDPAGGTHQEYVEDCEVCCRPWRVDLRIGADGHPTVSVGTLDEG